MRTETKKHLKAAGCWLLIAKLKRGGFMGGDDFQMKPVADAIIEQFAPSGYILVHGWGSADGRMQPWPSWLARRE